MKDCGHIYRLYTGSLCTTQTSRQDHGIIPGHLHFPCQSVAPLSGQAFHWLDTRGTCAEQASLQTFPHGKWRYQAPDRGITPKGAYSTKLLTLQEPDCASIEKGRDLATLYWLQRFKQNHSPESVSCPPDQWSPWSTKGRQVFQQYWSEVWLSPGPNWDDWCLEDCLQVSGRPFRVVGHAFRLN